MLKKALQPSSLLAFHEWLQLANDEGIQYNTSSTVGERCCSKYYFIPVEKQLLLKLIEVANSKESKMQKVIFHLRESRRHMLYYSIKIPLIQMVTEVFNPEPLFQIHDWLQTANDKG